MKLIVITILLCFLIEREHVEYTAVNVYDKQLTANELSFRKIFKYFNRIENDSSFKKELTTAELKIFNDIFKFNKSREKIYKSKLSGKILFLIANVNGKQFRMNVIFSKNKYFLLSYDEGYYYTIELIAASQLF